MDLNSGLGGVGALAGGGSDFNQGAIGRTKLGRLLGFYQDASNVQKASTVPGHALQLQRHLNDYDRANARNAACMDPLCGVRLPDPCSQANPDALVQPLAYLGQAIGGAQVDTAASVPASQSFANAVSTISAIAAGTNLQAPDFGLTPPQLQQAIDAANVIRATIPVIDQAIQSGGSVMEWTEMLSDFATITFSGGRAGSCYFLLEELRSDAPPSLRFRTSAQGESSMILSPNTRYSVRVYCPVLRLIGESVFQTPANGGRRRAPAIAIVADRGPDTDSDGLSDEAESILGTSPTNPDTDGDGISDGAELKNGSDPLSGIAVSTGVIARAPLSGNCTDIASGRDVIAAACGAEGVYVLGVRQGLTPTRLAQITVAPNVADRVTISSNLLAIGLGATGTMILDITVPDSPQFLRLVKVGSTVRCLAGAEGIIYIGLEDGRVAAVDMITGRLTTSVNLGATPHDLALGKGVLYAVTPGALRTIPVTAAGFGAVASVSHSGTAPNTTGRFRLFNGSNRLFLAHRTGITSFDLSAPATPVLMQHVTTAALGWSHLVAAGGNLAVATLGANNPDDVSLYDLGPNTDQANFLTTFTTPGVSTALTVYNGLAYVADGASGVSVVNFRAFDTARQAPTVTLAAETAGTTAEEGRFLPVVATATDDVQIRNVEFLVDGERQDTDGNFPFEARVLAPRIVLGKTTFTVQARAFDTGGNSALSNVLTFTLNPDTQSPQVLSFAPGNDALLATASGFTVRFTEPVAASSLNAASVYLWSAGADGYAGTDDDARLPVTLLPATDGSGAFRESGTFQTSAPLPPGRYRVLLTLGITDAKGNPLAAPYSSTFQVISGNDADADGILDDVEVALGLDPQNQDSNGNGVPDGAEDFDSDGLRNDWEIRYGFDPRVKDSNANGTNDNFEDTDRDTLNSLQEMAAGSDPTKADTDNDGWPDQVEVEFLSNAGDARSKPLSLFVGAPAVTAAILAGGATIAPPVNAAIIEARVPTPLTIRIGPPVP